MLNRSKVVHQIVLITVCKKKNGSLTVLQQQNWSKFLVAVDSEEHCAMFDLDDPISHVTAVT